MPAPSSMTFEEAVSEVLGRIGQQDDGVSNPLLVAEIKTHINAAQRKLIVEHGLEAQRRSLLVSVAAGRRYVDLPSDARRGQISQAIWIGPNDTQTPLRCGIAPDSRNYDPQRPAWYDFSPSTGIVSVSASGGTGYTAGVGTVSGGTRLNEGHSPIVTFAVNAGVLAGASVQDTGSAWSVPPTLTPLGGGSAGVVVATLGPITLVELCPIPSEAGTLVIEYQAAVSKLSNDKDLLALDAEAVISRAAVLLAGIKNLPCAGSLTQDFTAYMASFRAQQTPGRMVSLSGWRRDAADMAPTTARYRSA
jgi:hypothetical protein